MKYIVISIVVDFPSRKRHFDNFNHLFKSREDAEKAARHACIRLCEELNGWKDEQYQHCEDFSESKFRWTDEHEDFTAQVHFWDGEDYELVAGFTVKAVLDAEQPSAEDVKNLLAKQEALIDGANCEDKYYQEGVYEGMLSAFHLLGYDIGKDKSYA